VLQGVSKYGAQSGTDAGLSPSNSVFRDSVIARARLVHISLEIGRTAHRLSFISP
jgi:hypothetical protein